MVLIYPLKFYRKELKLIAFKDLSPIAEHFPNHQSEIDSVISEDNEFLERKAQEEEEEPLDLENHDFFIGDSTPAIIKCYQNREDMYVLFYFLMNSFIIFLIQI